MSKYTPEMVEDLTEDYLRATSDEERALAIDAFASTHKLTPQSVRMKLVREGVYVAKTRASRANKADRPSRDELLDAVREKFGADLRSLERASLKDLEVLVAS